MSKMINKVKMKRHESFSIREGWLSKGLLAVKENVKVFSCEESTDILGIGTNMVKSLKYWLFATNLIKDEKNSIVITKLGNLVLKYDPYMEDEFTWWMIHINMLLNQEDFYVGNVFFNKCISKNFSKEDVYKIISEHLNQKKLDFNEKILVDEINTIIKTYVVDNTNDTPENNFNSPLADLELLKRISKDNYERLKPDYRSLNYLVVYYLVIQNLDGRDYLSIDELLKIQNSPSKLLNLDKNLFNDYLDDMRREGLITINRTAGLNMIYVANALDLEEIFKKYFSRG